MLKSERKALRYMLMGVPPVFFQTARARRPCPLSKPKVCQQRDVGIMRWVVEAGQRDWVKLGEALGVCIRP